MNQRLDRIDGCHPIIKQSVLELVKRCEQQLKRTLFIVWGFRSVQEQMLLYQKGRAFNCETGIWEIDDPKLIVTKAMPGTSAHNVITLSGGRAAMGVDVIPLLSDGSADWKVDDEFWDRLYEIAWKVGLDPLGDPIGSYLAGDKGHFEEPCWELKLDGLGCYLPTNLASPMAVGI